MIAAFASTAGLVRVLGISVGVLDVFADSEILRSFIKCFCSLMFAFGNYLLLFKPVTKERKTTNLPKIFDGILNSIVGYYYSY